MVIFLGAIGGLFFFAVSLRERAEKSETGDKRSPLDPVSALTRPDESDVPDTVRALYKTPFELHGIVVDSLSGAPIPGVTVRARIVLNHQMPPSEKVLELKTDNKGRFAIEKEKGGSVSVAVSKDGYASLKKSPETSVRRFSTNENSGRVTTASTSFDDPAKFVLRRISRNRAVIHLEEKRYRKSEGDDPAIIPIAGGLTAEYSHKTDFDPSNPRNGWPWEVRLKCLGGGILERLEEDEFAAPVGGYENQFEFSFPKSKDIRIWRSSLSRSFYFRTELGTYGRMDIKIVGRNGDLFVEVWHDNGGSRNLE